MCVVAIAISLVGSANLAMAQTVPDLGAVTGSEANRAAHSMAVNIPTTASNASDLATRRESSRVGGGTLSWRICPRWGPKRPDWD